MLVHFRGRERDRGRESVAGCQASIHLTSSYQPLTSPHSGNLKQTQQTCHWDSLPKHLIGQFRSRLWKLDGSESSTCMMGYFHASPEPPQPHPHPSVSGAVQPSQSKPLQGIFLNISGRSLQPNISSEQLRTARERDCC